ncbi:MAG: FTR1 family protein [Melioribacteraceae bacterium]|nr:MAG: FTR1 family protein [Melioribacteraceae bacterium]
MKSIINTIFIVLTIYLTNFTTIFAQPVDKTKVRSLISLLDYIGTDYPNAISDGKIINEMEYEEMKEFGEEIEKLFSVVASQLVFESENKIEKSILMLSRSINNKINANELARISTSIKKAILKLNLISVTPKHWPDIINGENLFDENCASCHGSEGVKETAVIKNLNPAPADMLDHSLMRKIAPLQIYNTVRLGVSGTAMPPFDNLTDEQIWDVAFYVSALRYLNDYENSTELVQVINSASTKVSFEELALYSDEGLLSEKLIDKNDNYKNTIASLRLHKPEHQKKVTIEIAAKMLESARKQYEKGSIEIAEERALAAYLEGIEPFESQLQSIDPNLKNEIESAMFRIRSEISGGIEVKKLNASVAETVNLINKASHLLTEQKFTFWVSFALAASIILREGIEAFLIIITILSVLKSVGAGWAEKFVHAGWISALFIGIVSMFFVNLIISFGAQNRELMEGFGSLFPVLILLYVGFWLHSKTEAKRWKDFVENKIVRLVRGKNLIGLAVLSFVVVFREAFESVIFLSTINLESSEGGMNGSYFGAGISLLVVLTISWAAVKFAVKLPIAKLFKYSAFTLAVLSIIIMGKAIHSLQEGGYIGVTQITDHLKLSFIGFYPTVETTFSQIALLILTIILWKYAGRIPVKRRVVNKYKK